MKLFSTALILTVLAAAPVSADIFYFKDGGEIEGVAQEETETHIVIDMGFGSMTVRKDEIDHIEKAAPEGLERLEQVRKEHEIKRGAWAPAEHEDIRMLYSAAKESRGALKKAQKKLRMDKNDVIQKEKESSKLLKELGERGKELKEIDPEKNVTEYNAAVTELNTMNAELDKINKKLKTFRSKEKGSAASLAKLGDKYRRDFNFFKDTLSKQQDSFGKDGMADEELSFFEEMNTQALDMEGDFKKDASEYTPEGSHVMVNALLDENVSVQLMVDTGASIVVISSDVAQRLGIAYEDITDEMEIIVADGRSVKAKPVMLTSVKIGDSEAKNIQAAILDKGDIGGADGLLGMSFLSHFKFSIDSTANKLTLEQIQ